MGLVKVAAPTAPPTVSINAPSGSGLGPYTFPAPTVSEPCTYAWSVYGGPSSATESADASIDDDTSATPAITATKGGVYTVVLVATATATGVSTRATYALATVALGSGMSLSITGASDTAASLAGQTLTATPTGASGSVTYSWTATSPTSSSAVTSVYSSTTSQTPTFTPSSAGAWRVSCTATDAVGSVTATITTRRGYLLDAVTLTPVNPTDGSWTFADSAGILGSANYSSETLTLTTGTIGTGNETYAPTVTANFTGPRWYKALTDNSGTALTSDDHFIHVVEIEHVASVSSPPQRTIYGVAEDPTSTTLTTIKLGGACIAYGSAGGNPALESATVAAINAIAANASNRVLRTVTVFRPSVLPPTLLTGYDATGANRGSAYQASSTSFTASTPLYRCLAHGAFNASSTWTAGLDTRLKIREAIIRISPDPSAS